MQKTSTMNYILTIAAVCILAYLAFYLYSSIRSASFISDFTKQLGTGFKHHKISGNLHLYTSPDSKEIHIALTNFAHIISRKINDYVINKIVVLYSRDGFVTFDETKREILFVKDSNMFHLKLDCNAISYDDIISVQLLKGNVKIYENSGIDLGRSMAGGALGGSTGAVIAGFSGSTEYREKIKSLKIKLLLKDTMNPSYTYTLFEDKNLYGNEVEKYFNDAYKIIDTIKVILATR